MLPFLFIYCKQSVLVGDLTKGYHIGYFRDSPKELPAFLASSTEVDGCIIHPMAENLFEVMRCYFTSGFFLNWLCLNFLSCQQFAHCGKTEKMRPFC